MRNIRNIRKVKYLHIIWHPDLKFIPKLIQMINEQNGYFNVEEHLFITPHKRVYDALCDKYEIHLCGKEQSNLINQYGKYGEWIFVHAINCNIIRVAFTKNKYAKKVIWRTWGHDIRPLSYYDGWKRIVAGIFWPLYKSKVRKFHSIAVANDIDVINAETVFGKMNNCVLNYSYDPIKDKLLQQYENKPDEIKSKNTRILIGHSASVWDCHIDMMKKLMKYKDENITICLVLSYAGSKDYVEKVRKFAKDNFKNKVEIIDKFMVYEEYIEYLSNIDIAIFAQKHSTALSNVSWLLHFGKTIYFREDSDFGNSFKRSKCEFCKIEEIENMTFEQFSKRKNSSELMSKYGVISTSEDCCRNWKNTLDKLCEEEK